MNHAYAESSCDIRPGISVGVRVIEFFSGNLIHSKIPMKQSTADALLEEMVSLQDMGICEEKIISKKCILKYEKHINKNIVTIFRSGVKWSSWKINAKENAQMYIRSLKRVGFCS